MSKNTIEKPKSSKKKGGGEDKGIPLYSLKLPTMIIPIRGTSPLIVHRFGSKAEEMMKHVQAKGAKKAREARDPEAEFHDARHLNADGQDCFPAVGFKLAAVRAGKFCNAVMADLKGAFHVLGDLVPIKYKDINMRTDHVRIGMGTTDLRYRPEYIDWSCELEVKYNAEFISQEQLINLFNVAGFSAGIGEMRPQKGYQFGMFEVDVKGPKK